MSNIKVQCIGQAVTFLNTPVISSGNMNYDTIGFEFCSKWDGYVKTAIFYRTKEEVYYQLLDDSDSCLIPNEVLGEKGVIYIGVFGTLGDKTITSQVLRYRIQEGAVTEDLKPSDPTPDIYSQLVGKYAEYEAELKAQQLQLDEFKTTLDEYEGNAERLGGHLPEYFATAQSVTNVIDGVTPVGKAKNADKASDSNTLEGHGANYFAKAEDLKAVTDSTLIFSGVSVAVDSWTEDTTYADYPYKADIACEGVTEDYFSDVVLSLSEATSGNYAPNSETGSGVVIIYAKEIPAEAITIPAIKCEKVVAV